MTHVRKSAVVVFGTAALLARMAPSPAHADASGGTPVPPVQSAKSGGAQAPPASLTGGSEDGISALPIAPARPTVRELSVPATATAGRPPQVTVRIDEPGVGTVNLRVILRDSSTRKAVVVVAMGWVRTGRALTVDWPRGTPLRPGRYRVSITAHDHHTGTLLRTAHSSGAAALTIIAPASAPTVPVATGPTPEAGVLTPAQSAAAGAAFPVVGAHNFGGPENRFGAPRNGYVHQGQDVLTAEGTPIVVPFAGTILTTSYQPSGGGYYAVEHTAVGFDFMFAHCMAGSIAVRAGQTVAAGQGLCQAGHSGGATTPHLHFEMWVGGWQAATGHPIDPLPYLEAWERAGGR
jgi:murein DD-endopeptidase MepM/ murein hydrolase activator NlpD